VLFLLLCTLTPGAGCADQQRAERRIAMADGPDLTTQEAAIERARKLSGLHELTQKIEARRNVIAASNLPFLSNQVLGKPAWFVTFFEATLRLPNSSRGARDEYPREFVVVLLEQGGKLVSISSIYQGEHPDLRPPAPADSAQEQLEDEEEIYTGFPAQDPKVRFLEALGVVMAKGSGNPYAAKTIEAVYVTETLMGAPPRAVWAITLRGLPPFRAHGRGADSVPVWQRNHMRNVLDAMTGEFLFATNSPQP
jgi:hypothetical protein